jgi:hypothetical protein
MTRTWAPRPHHSRVAMLGLLLLLLSVGVGLPAPAHASASYPPITGTITGPDVVGLNLQAQYQVNATGGPAYTLQGFPVGNVTFNATLSGNNITGASIQPPTGVLVNGEVGLRFVAPNVTEEVTLRVELTSTYKGTSASANLTRTISIVAPYVLSGVLIAGPTTVTGFNMTVTVDGTSVGRVVVPTISANGSYRFTYDYVPQSLAPGWHTIAVSVAPEHGLVSFAGGVMQLATTFYVSGPAPDVLLDASVGIAAIAAAVFIWGSVVGARRRGRPSR